MTPPRRRVPASLPVTSLGPRGFVRFATTTLGESPPRGKSYRVPASFGRRDVHCPSPTRPKAAKTDGNRDRPGRTGRLVPVRRFCVSFASRSLGTHRDAANSDTFVPARDRSRYRMSRIRSTLPPAHAANCAPRRGPFALRAAPTAKILASVFPPTLKPPRRPRPPPCHNFSAIFRPLYYTNATRKNNASMKLIVRSFAPAFRCNWVLCGSSARRLGNFDDIVDGGAPPHRIP